MCGFSCHSADRRQRLLEEEGIRDDAFSILSVQDTVSTPSEDSLRPIQCACAAPRLFYCCHRHQQFPEQQPEEDVAWGNINSVRVAASAHPIDKFIFIPMDRGLINETLQSITTSLTASHPRMRRICLFCCPSISISMKFNLIPVIRYRKGRLILPKFRSPSKQTKGRRAPPTLSSKIVILTVFAIDRGRMTTHIRMFRPHGPYGKWDHPGEPFTSSFGLIWVSLTFSDYKSTQGTHQRGMGFFLGDTCRRRRNDMMTVNRGSLPLSTPVETLIRIPWFRSVFRSSVKMS